MIKSAVKPGYRNFMIRLALALFIMLLSFNLLYLFLVLPSLRDDIYREKMLQTNEMVDIALSVLGHFRRLEVQGVLNRDMAQREAARLIRSMNYGREGLDYFWINDFDHYLIVHPFRADLEGTDVSEFQDPEGVFLFREFVEICEREGGGHVAYSWQYYGQRERFEEKLSYVAAFEPWGWIVGTGVYLTDLEAIIALRRNIAILLMVLFFSIAATLAYSYYKVKVAEQQLIQSEEKYRLIAENTADTITVMDMNLNFLYVSPSICKLRGYTPEEAMSGTLDQVLTPPSLQLALEAFQQEIASAGGKGIDPEKILHLELEQYHKDGSKIWVDNTLSFIKDEAGNPTGILAISRDITERKRHEEILDKEQREKTLILENLAELVTYMDCEMRIIWASPVVGRAHRKKPSEYLGRRCYEVWHGYSKPCPGCPVVRALETGQVCRSVVAYPDGPCWKMTGSPVFDEEGRIIGVLDLALEISDLYEAERELKRLNEELEQRVRERTAELERINKELAAFTYSVSHDLRAPLRSIEGFSEAVLEDHSAGLDQQGKNYLKRVHAASRRMSELINDLLKLSRVTRQELNRDRVNLSAIVDAYARHLQEKEPGRKAEFKIAPNLYITGDGALLRIALENLLENAWKFTSKNGLSEIEFGAVVENGRKIFYVRDNGVGFDMNKAEKIFDAFQRLHPDREYSGSGIGLSIVQRIIERHGGRVWAESGPGRGATFFIALPEPEPG